MEFTSLKKALVPSQPIEIETESGISKIYKLVLDMNAIARAQEELGKDFALLVSWQGMTSLETVKMFHFALHKHHSEITWDEVGSWFSPDHIPQLNNLLIDLAFPGTLDRIKKSLEDKAKGEAVDAPAVGAS